METDIKISNNSKWRLKRVNKFWFIDVRGKLKWLNMLDNATEVFMEENLIFADKAMYQVFEERHGEVMITKVTSSKQVNVTSYCEQNDVNIQTEKNEKPDLRSEKDTKDSEVTFHLEEDSFFEFIKQNKEQKEDMGPAAGKSVIYL
jgi:hypothetical protein